MSNEENIVSPIVANSKVQHHSLLEAADYAVSQTTVQAGGETQWHHHTNVSDRWVVVRGVLTVEYKEGNQVRRVEVRDYFSVAPGVSHHIKNETGEEVVYILTQSTGKRDIVQDGEQAA